jgi:hypothetical protein
MAQTSFPSHRAQYRSRSETVGESAVRLCGADRAGAMSLWVKADIYSAKRHVRFTPKRRTCAAQRRQRVRVMRQSVAVYTLAEPALALAFGLFGTRTSPFRSSRASPFLSRGGLRRHLLAPLIDQLSLGPVIFIEIEITVAVTGNAVAFTMLCVLPEPPLRECRFWPTWRT